MFPASVATAGNARGLKMKKSPAVSGIIIRNAVL